MKSAITSLASLLFLSSVAHADGSLDKLNAFTIKQLTCLQDPDWRPIIAHLGLKSRHVNLDEHKETMRFGLCFTMVKPWDLNGLNIVKICGPNRPANKFETDYMYLFASNSYKEIAAWITEEVGETYADVFIRPNVIECWPKG